MTSAKAGGKRAGNILFVAAGLCLLASCNSSIAYLRPAWQQDSNLFHQGFPARVSQTTDTPHMVARVLYAEPERLMQMVERQGDVADSHRGLVRVGDGTLEIGVQDAASGSWMETLVCGGNLFVAGMPSQAYRLVIKNRTPLPLELRVGVDGKDLQTGGKASLGRGSIRVESRHNLVLDRTSQGPLLFKKVSDDSALFDTSPQGGKGLIQLAVFLAADAPSVGPEKLRPDQIAPLGLFPIGRPEQYR